MEGESLLANTARGSRVRLILVIIFLFLVITVVSLSIAAIALSAQAIKHDNDDHAPDCGYPARFHGELIGSPYTHAQPNTTILTNASIWTANGTVLHAHDLWIGADGKITKIASTNFSEIPNATYVFDVHGAFVTPGLIDLHSHVGVSSFPLDSQALRDHNEATYPVLPQAQVKDSFNPNDPAIALLLEGGITTSQVLPGSANLVGGQAFYVKMVGKTVAEMAVPDAPLAFKLAMGENPKRVYGRRTELPSTRMGNTWVWKEILAEALTLKGAQDAYDCAGSKSTARPYDAQLEPVVSILRNTAKINVHCYTVNDFEAILRLSDQFGVNITTFHHALEAWKIPQVFAQRNITVALFTDRWGAKIEMYDGSVHAARILTDAGVSVAIKTDHPVIFGRYLIYEAAKAFHWGLSESLAIAAVTSVPARAMGISDQVGTLEVGKQADVLVWDRHPLVLGAKPFIIFVNGTLAINNPLPVNISTSVPVKSTVKLAPFNESACSLPLRNYAVNNTRIYKSDGSLVSGMIIVEDGNVFDVCEGDFCDPPPGTTVFNAQGGISMPGLINVDSSLGLIEIEQEASSGEGTSSVTNSGVVYAADGIKMSGSKHLTAAFKGGVTVQLAIPQGSNLIAGVSAAFYTYGSVASKALVKREVALHINIGNSVKSSGGLAASISGQFALLRQTFRTSTQQNSSSDPIAKALSGEIPMVFRVHQADQISAILALKLEMDLPNVVILGGAEAHLLAEDLAAAGVSVILSPGPRQAPDTYETAQALENSTVILNNANVKVALAEPFSGSVRELRWSAGLAIAEGLPISAAYDSITKNVADILSLPYGLGTISATNPANFVVYSGDPFSLNSDVLMVAERMHLDCNPVQY